MTRFVVTSIVLLMALSAAAKDNFPVNSALCWCICDASNPNAADGIPMWENKSGAACKLSEGKACNQGTANAGTLKSCDGCQTNAQGECIAGSSAIHTPANATLLPTTPWTLTTRVPAGTAKPVAPVAKPVEQTR